MSRNRIVLLGTGTSVGIPMIGCDCEVCHSEDSRDIRLRSSAVFQINDKNILVDIGPDFRQQMLIHRITRLDAILLTHPHRDHIGGFDDIRALNFLYEAKIPVYLTEMTKESLMKQFYYAFQKSDYTSMPQANFHLITNTDPIDIEGIEAIPIQVLHGNMPCMGFKIDKIAYITDANFIEEREFKKLQNLDVLILNALRKYHHPSHYTLDEAIRIAQRVQARSTYFTHISHHMGKHEDVEKELPDSIHLGFDGLIAE